MLLELNKCVVIFSIVYCERLHHLMQILVTCSLSSASEVYSKLWLCGTRTNPASFYVSLLNTDQKKK